jgi:hypothetical protein
MSRKLTVADTIVVVVVLAALVAYHLVTVHNLKKDYQAQQAVMFQSMGHGLQGKAFILGFQATLRNMHIDTNTGRYYLEVTNVLNEMRQFRNTELTNHLGSP